MIVISYDIHNNKLRTQFSKFLAKNGAIRLQLSVYEINNTNRIIETIKIKIEMYFKKKFDGGDSVLIFSTDENKAVKYGNAIHRDQPLIFFS